MTRSKELSGGASTFGGLDRAVEGLSGAMNEIGIRSGVLYLEARSYRETNNAQLVEQLRDQALDDGYTWVHFHDWYGAPLARALFCAGFRNIGFTAHLPLRRGFTYLDALRSFDDKVIMEAELLDMARLVVAPSDLVRALLLQEYGLDPSRVHVVGHGVDTRVFYPGSVEKAAEPTVLFAGRLERQKGVELLLYAMQRVARALPDVRLRLAGDGSLASELPNLAKRLGIANNCAFMGALGNEDLRTEYTAADLLVMPSLFEPFGLVGLEALSCGCDVLSIAPTGAEYLEARQLTRHVSPNRLGTCILGYLQQGVRGDGKKQREQAAKWTWAESARHFADQLGNLNG